MKNLSFDLCSRNYGGENYVAETAEVFALLKEQVINLLSGNFTFVVSDREIDWPDGKQFKAGFFVECKKRGDRLKIIKLVNSVRPCYFKSV